EGRGGVRVLARAATSGCLGAWGGAAPAAPRGGSLYPPIAANLTILLFQTVATRPLLHTAQRLVAHRRGDAGTELTVTGTVTERDEKSSREEAPCDAGGGRPPGGPRSAPPRPLSDHTPPPRPTPPPPPT